MAGFFVSNSRRTVVFMDSFNKNVNFKTLITYTVNFIGFHLFILLLDKGYRVIDVDNMSDYYNIHLK
jgi:UDP-glucuronate 4-epimerase